MNELKTYLTAAVLMAAALPLYGQPPGYREDETAILPGSGTVTLALAWGEQLTPSPRYPKVVINLKESLVKYARAPVDIRPNFRLGTGDLMKLSIVLITTDSQFELTPTEIRNLRDYIRQGGMVVVDDAGAGMPNSSSGASMRKMIREIAGRGRYDRIPGTHPIYQTPFRMDGPPNGSNLAVAPMGQRMTATVGESAHFLNGVFLGDRLAILYIDRGFTPFWNSLSSDAYMKFWVNVVSYALAERAATL